MSEWTETATKILDAAEEFIKTKGVNAFSFRDLQKVVGVKTSSIHYHFATKLDLIHEVAVRFLGGHKMALDHLQASEASPSERLRKVARYFAENGRKGEFCLGGMLSSDARTLDEKTQKILLEFFDHFETWAASSISEGLEKGEFRSSVNPEYSSRLFVSAIEGGMLKARLMDNSDAYFEMMNELIDNLSKDV